MIHSTMTERQTPTGTVDFSGILSDLQGIGNVDLPSPMETEPNPSVAELWRFDLLPTPTADTAFVFPLSPKRSRSTERRPVEWEDLFAGQGNNGSFCGLQLPPVPGDPADCSAVSAVERRDSWPSDSGRASDDSSANSYQSDSSDEVPSVPSNKAREHSPPATRLRARSTRPRPEALSVAAIRRARRERYGCGTRKVQPRRFDLLVKTITAGEAKLLAAAGVAVPVDFPCDNDTEAHVRGELRKIRNKASAQRSRGNKETLIVSLEQENEELTSANATLTRKIGRLESKAASLQSELSVLRAKVVSKLSDGATVARGVATGGLALACAAVSPMVAVGDPTSSDVPYSGFAPDGLRGRGLLAVPADSDGDGSAWTLAVQVLLLCCFVVAGYAFAGYAFGPRFRFDRGGVRASAPAPVDADDTDANASPDSWENLVKVLETTPSSLALSSAVTLAESPRKVSGLDYTPRETRFLAPPGVSRPFIPYSGDKCPYGRISDADRAPMRH